VARDGSFLVRRLLSGDEPDIGVVQLHVVLNFFRELRERVPN
jgi:hypothetical protein